MATPPPILVLSSGRCGSTMLSAMLNLHPRVLSLSEFFSAIGPAPAVARRRPTGEWFWRLLSRQRLVMRVLGRNLESVSEVLYPIRDPSARFTYRNLPPIMMATLPHLTDDYEALYDELGPIVRRQPKRLIGNHCRWLFGWLADRFGGDLWVERSGGTVGRARMMLRHFPEARVIHLVRDGRNTALSMRHHGTFRSMVAVMKHYESRGIDIFRWLRRVENSDRLTSWLFDLGFRFLPRQLPYDKLTVADFGRFWRMQMSAANRVLDTLPPDRLLNMKFEDIQRNPKAEVRRMIRFIDPSLEDSAWVREAAAVCRPAVGRPKYMALAPTDRQALEDACGPALELFGYKTDGP